jgi:hypothetical protein
MSGVRRTFLRKEKERRLRLGRQPAWACLFVDGATGQTMGARFIWPDGPLACSPDEHYTEDGRTFRRVSNVISPIGEMVKQMGEIEGNPEKLASLARLMAAYEESLGVPVFNL